MNVRKEEINRRTKEDERCGQQVDVLLSTRPRIPRQKMIRGLGAIHAENNTDPS
jgi:hypothetical protein